MATLNIEGNKVTVDDAFLQMSPEDQSKTVDQIATQLKLGAGGGPPAGGTQAAAPSQPVPVAPSSVGVTDVVRSAATGVPVVGGLLNKLDAATNAALAPIVEPFLSKGPDTLDQPTYGERYAKSLDIQNKRDQKFSTEHPIIDTTAKIAGGVASTAPLVMAAPAAFGVGGAKLLPSMGAGAVTGGALGAADAATRGEDAGQGAMFGAGGGAAGPLIGKIVGSAVKLGGPAKAPIPSTQEIKDAASALYQHPDVKALQIKPAAAAQVADDIGATLLKSGVDDIVAPQTTQIIERLKVPRFGPTTTIEDIDGARKALGNVTPNEMRAAAIARGEIDNYLGKIPQADVLAGDAGKANKILLEARANAAAAFRDEAVKKALSNAEINTAASYSGGNIDNATRQQLKPILKNILKTQNAKTGMFQGWTPEEVLALKSAVLGNPIGNLLRGIGKMGPNGGLMGGLHLAAGFQTGGSTLPLSIAGLAAKKTADAMTKNSAEALSELLRSRAPASAATLLQNQLANTKNAARRLQLQKMISALTLGADQARIQSPSSLPSQQQIPQTMLGE